MFCFFFQAEDGIRDLVRSRGLGDVYKRQLQQRAAASGDPRLVFTFPVELPADTTSEQQEQWPVSYTHLTLPTSDLV